MRNESGPRIACIQYGDYAGAVRGMEAGRPESYRGQAYCVRAQQKFFSRFAHRVVYINDTDYRETNGDAEWVGVGRPGPSWMPERFREAWLGRRLYDEVVDYRPTHLMMRVGEILGTPLLEWANRTGVKSAVFIAGTADPQNPRWRAYGKAANHPLVGLVSNHNRVATQSLVDCGVDPAKTLAWDLPMQTHPDQFPVRTLSDVAVPVVLFAGTLCEDKGVPELVAAWEKLNAAGRKTRLVLCGNGPLFESLSKRAERSGGLLEVPGHVTNDEVFARMLSATLIVVPSRPIFPEGIPFVIGEALSSRAPVLLSDHPVFKSYFRDGQGVRFFESENPGALATAIGTLLDDPESYRRFSVATAEAWQSIQVDVKFHDVLDRLEDVWGLNRPTKTTIAPGPQLAAV